MMMMMSRVMCVLAVVLCCACGCGFSVMGESVSKNGFDFYASSWEGFPGKDPKPENADIRNSGGIREGENQLQEQRQQSLGGHGSVLEEIKNQETLHEESDMITSSSSDHPPQISPNHDSDGHQNSLSPDSTLELPRPKEAPQIHVTAEKESSPVSAPSIGTVLPSGASETLTTTSTTTASTTPGDVDSTQTNLPAESAKPTDMSNANDNITAQQPSPAAESTLSSDVNSGNEFNAAPGTSPTAAAQENGNADSTATTNINSEAPTTTPSPLTDPPISKIAPTMKNKANVDSSVSPVWMRTAASLLIVAVLFSVTVY